MGASSTAVMPETLRRTARGVSGGRTAPSSAASTKRAVTKMFSDNCAVGEFEGYECLVPSQENEEVLSHSVGDALGVVEGAFDTADPVALGRAFARGDAARRDPSVLVGTGLGSLRRRARCRPARASGPGSSASSCPTPPPPTRRTHGSGGRAWQDNAFFHALLESYLLTERLMRELRARRAARRPRAARRRSSRRSCSATRSRPRTSCPPTRSRWCARSRPRAAAWSAAPATSSTTWSRITGGRARSTARRSRWARTSRSRRARSCSATS